MSSIGGIPPQGDLTGRMALFGRMFAQQAGLVDPSNVPSPEDLVALVRLHIPRDATTSEEAPVYEAAAYIGEWLRAQAGAEWIADSHIEPHLQVNDESGALIFLLPLVSIVRTAATAGYDGLPRLLREVRDDIVDNAKPIRLGALRVHPSEDRSKVVEWARANRDIGEGTRVALWRRCSACGTPHEDSVTMPATGLDWESEAGLATGLLAERPFECPCGGMAGDVSRLLMLRREAGTLRFGDIYVTPNFTRVACWTLEDDNAVPLDARQLADERAAPT